MLNVSVIGIGNAGGQVAEKAASELHIPAMAINSSERDLSTISDSVKKFLISDSEGFSQGAGKNRSLAKSYLKDSIIKLLSNEDFKEFVNANDVVFIVSSTGGGTGSGTAPLMTSILNTTFVDTKFVMVGITPVNNEALSAQVNSLEYLKEVHDILRNQTYMIYDNDKMGDLPSYQMMSAVNEEIVRDIDVIRCAHNNPTPYDSIDEEDMSRLISFPGLLNVVRLEGIREKDLNSCSIEDLLLKKLKTNAHVDFQRDKAVTATGVISNLDETLGATFDNHIPKVIEYIGTPDHDFNHVAINHERNLENSVYLIMSGMSMVSDKIRAISDRINQIQDQQSSVRKEDDEFGDIDIRGLSTRISAKDTRRSEPVDEANLANIFNMFEV